MSATVDSSATGGESLLPSNANTANVGGIVVSMNGMAQGPSSLSINGLQCTISG